MSRFRRRTTVVEATQWFRNGDHPEDRCELIFPSPHSTTQFEPFLSEGKVVRYFRHPSVSGDQICSCGETLHNHGWIDSPRGSYTVCPGDWVLTGEDGKHWPVKDQVFRGLYEPAE